MFKNVEELINLSDSQKKPIHEVMIEIEVETSGKSREEVVSRMRRQYEVMGAAIEKGVAGAYALSGLTGGDGKRIADYVKAKKYITDEIFVNAICYGIATNEVNSAMGLVCANPTAGSAGVVPAVLFAVKDKLNLSDEDCVNFLFDAAAFGLVIANNASIAGASGGCQAEVGSASAMAAAALVLANGGTNKQAGDALAIALKNMMGLVCDPVAGLVEVPCIKRNAAGATNALCAAEMVLAGVVSQIPPDEVIEACDKVGKAMTADLRETARGGVATTKTGFRIKEKVFGKKVVDIK